MTVAVAGATGYIGKAVVRECLRRGFKTKAYVREESMERAKTLDYLKGAEVGFDWSIELVFCGGPHHLHIDRPMRSTRPSTIHPQQQ